MSVTLLNLSGCSLTKDTVDVLFRFLSVLSYVKKVNLSGNNLHGLMPVQVSQVLSLESLILTDCSLQKNDMKGLFYIIAAVGNIKWVILRKNNLCGLQKGTITPVSSLLSLDLTDCGLENGNMKPLLCMLSRLPNVQRVNVNNNDIDKEILASLGLNASPEFGHDVEFVENSRYVYIFSINKTYLISRNALRRRHSANCFLIWGHGMHSDSSKFSSKPVQHLDEGTLCGALQHWELTVQAVFLIWGHGMHFDRDTVQTVPWAEVMECTLTEIQCKRFPIWCLGMHFDWDIVLTVSWPEVMECVIWMRWCKLCSDLRSWNVLWQKSANCVLIWGYVITGFKNQALVELEMFLFCRFQIHKSTIKVKPCFGGK